MDIEEDDEEDNGMKDPKLKLLGGGNDVAVVLEILAVEETTLDMDEEADKAAEDDGNVLPQLPS